MYAPSVLNRVFESFETVDRHAILRALFLLQQLVESPLRFSVASTLTAFVYLSGLFAGKSELYSVRSPQPTHQLTRSEDDAQG
jgi:hypothetical protein